MYIDTHLYLFINPPKDTPPEQKCKNYIVKPKSLSFFHLFAVRARVISESTATYLLTLGKDIDTAYSNGGNNCDILL